MEDQMEVTESRRNNVAEVLEQLAAEVAQDQAAIDGQCEDTRKRVLRMGKRLAQLQKIQKKEQDTTGQTWKEWCAEEKGHRVTFPAFTNCKQYVLIARYPKAYRAGMSIREAYKEAGKWKKNGGNPPPLEKLTIKQRPLITIGAAAGKLANKIEKLMDLDIQELAGEQEWTDDEIDGAVDELTLLKQECTGMLQKLRSLRAST